MVHSNTVMAPIVEDCASLPDMFFFKPTAWVKEALSAQFFSDGEIRGGGDKYYNVKAGEKFCSVQ